MSTIRVDRITPYQSGSVAIEGLNITNLTIDGTLTASLQQGYVWVGGSGNVSTLAPTSSFAGGVDITALNTFTASADGRLDNLELTTSSLQNQVNALNSFTTSADGRLDNLELTTSSADGRLDNLELTTASLQNEVDSLQALTGSYATTGSNIFVGNQIISGSLTISGSSTFRNIGPTILSGSVNISGSINSDGYELAASSTSTIPALNSTFNLDLVPSGSTTTFINKSLVLGDGKILVAGRFQRIDGHTTNDIARLNSDGTIDTSFTAPMFSGSNFVGGDTAGWINTFATQSDGKIVVGGNFIRVGEGGDARRGIARLNTNGTLDTSFVTQSFESFGSSNGVRDLVIQNDGKIVFVGSFTSGSRRVNTDGTIDTSFDISQGNNQPGAFNNSDFYSVALLDSGSDQAVLIGGRFSSWGSYGDYTHLVKLNPNGTLDFGFGGINLDILFTSDGYNAGDRIQKIKVGDDGYIYVAGRFKDTGIGNHAGFGRVTTTDEGFGVGALDNGFRTYISGSYVNDFDFYDGDKILLGGDFTLFGNPGFSTTSANRFAIIDQNDGGLVTNWSTDGLASKYNLNTGSVNSVTLLPSNNVLVGGSFTSASFPSTAREGLASLKLTGFGDVTTTIDYSITADTNQLLISSSNTYFSGDITASVISGSFVGDGSGLTNLVLPSGVVSGSSQLTASLDSRYLNVSGEGTISGSFTGSFVGDGSGLTGITLPSGILSSSETNFTDFSQSVDTRIDNIVAGTGFATTGSNTFVGNQIVTGSIAVSGSISQKGIGTGNIVIGDDPITNLSSDAQYNTVIGADAGVSLRSGSNNVFIGRMAGLLTQDSNGNVFIGATAGYNTKAEQNIYIGESAGFSNISGRYNVTIGHNSGYNNKVDANTFIGYQSGFANTSGSYNTFVGIMSGNSNTIGNNNSFFGGTAGRDNSVGNNNTFIGQNAGQQNTSGSNSTFVGSQAGSYTTTGNNNTFVGAQAGILNTTGYSNAFFGDNSGYNNTTAYENTFVGGFAGYENTIGARNTFVGLSAGQNTRIGNDNTYIGHGAGISNISGSNNTFVGLHTGFNITSGSDNTFLGKNSGYYISDGSSAVSGSNRSVFIGTNVKSNGHDETNQIVIGYDAIGNGTNTVTIGNDDITDTYVKGTLRASTAILAQVSSSYDFADDTAAQAGGVPLGGLYHTSGSIKIRLV